MAAATGKYTLTLEDKIHYGFFASHIPITLLMDGQALLPANLFPPFARAMNSSYCEMFKDPLMSQPPIWFKSLIGCEYFLQLPFFCAALYAMHTGGSWIRLPGIAYSAHVCTTLVPVLAHILFDQNPHGVVPFSHRLGLAAVYSPYLLIPLWYGLSLARRKTPYVRSITGSKSD